MNGRKRQGAQWEVEMGLRHPDTSSGQQEPCRGMWEQWGQRWKPRASRGPVVAPSWICPDKVSLDSFPSQSFQLCLGSLRVTSYPSVAWGQMKETTWLGHSQAPGLGMGLAPPATQTERKRPSPKRKPIRTHQEKGTRPRVDGTIDVPPPVSSGH